MLTEIPTVSTALRRVTQRQFLGGKRWAKQFERVVRVHLEPAFGTCLLTDLTSQQLESYAASLTAGGLQPSTVNLILGPLRAAFKLYADELGIRMPRIILLEVRNAREVFFERSEFERVVGELPGPLRPPARFMYFTGWRLRSEVLMLRWSENIRWDSGLIVLPATMTKGKRKREFPFTALPELESLLRDQHLRTPEGCPWVFSRFGGKRIVNPYEAWHGAVERAGLEHRVPHDLRRTAARNLRRVGVPDNVIMQLVGWSTIAMLYRYLGRADESDLREAVGRLAGGTRAN